MTVSCGVIVGVENRLLIGQATMSPRWDIPKGIAETDESWDSAAIRELREETGLVAELAALIPLGVHPYLPRKQLALFAWRPAAPIALASLRCSSTVRTRDGRLIPELARFALVAWDEALRRVGKNMARVLREIGPERALGSD